MIQILIDITLVVAQIQVSFGAVIGDEHLAVLIRAHGTGIHIDIRVQLLSGDPQSATF